MLCRLSLTNALYHDFFYNTNFKHEPACRQTGSTNFQVIILQPSFKLPIAYCQPSTSNKKKRQPYGVTSFGDCWSLKIYSFTNLVEELSFPFKNCIR